MDIDMIKDLYKNKLDSKTDLKTNSLNIYLSKGDLRIQSAKENKEFDISVYAECDFMVETHYEYPYRINGKVSLGSIEGELIKRDELLNKHLKEYNFDLISNAIDVKEFKNIEYFRFTIKEFYKFKKKGKAFSEVLADIKAGKRAQRKGWNGRGMFIYYVSEDRYTAKTKAAKDTFGKDVPYLPYLALKTADEKVVPWTISQTDVLVEDWIVLDN